MVNILLSVLSGLLTGLSFNFSGLSFLPWVCLTPFIYAISKSRLKDGIFSGIVFALCYYGTAIFWIANVTKLGFILLLFYFSFYYVSFFLLGKYFLGKPLRIITIPSLWVVCEFLKENIWCGFGWGNLGYSQYKNLYFIQAADLLGTKFLSFLIVMVNVLIWEIFRCLSRDDRRSRRIIFKKVILVLFIFLSSFIYSFYRLSDLKEEGFLELSIVQPNIPQELKWEFSASASIMDRLNILGKETKNDTLVIFPEAAWPFIVNKRNFCELEQFAKDIKRDIVMGATTENQGQFHNTALLFNKEGTLMSSYRKIKLVPFGEYVPLRKFLSFINVINSIGDMNKGREYVKFPYEGKNFSVLICFEDIFPLHVLRFARGNDFLINITNDAWFGGEPQASQHLSIMTLRAVENRISIVRSANTGISGWVSFRGGIEKLKRGDKELFFPEEKSFVISLSKRRSFYAKYGDFFPFCCFIFLLAIFIAGQKPAFSRRIKRIH